MPSKTRLMRFDNRPNKARVVKRARPDTLVAFLERS
jgi:hypothetical protein